MKKTVSVLLFIMLLVQLSPAALAAETPQPEHPVWVELDFVNNIDYNATVMGGVYFDGAFYVPADTLARYSNGRVVENTPDGIRLEVFAREIFIAPDSTATDYLVDGAQRRFAVPVLMYEGQLCASLLHLYRYLGIEIAFAEKADSPLHLYINCPYTIYDAMEEYVEDMGYYQFGIDEVLQGGWSSELIKKSAALDTMLIHYDSNVLNHTFRTTTAAEDLLADCLIEIVREEGIDYNSAITGEAKTFSDRAALGIDLDGTMFDLADKAAKAYGRSAMTIDDAVGDVLGKAGFIAQAAGIYFDVMGVYRLYENIPAEQVTLLERTLCRVRSSSPLYQSYPELFVTARNVQHRVTDANYNATLAMERASHATISTVLSNTKQSFLTSIFGLPYAAINAVYSITTAFAETDPVFGEYVGDEIALTQARGCIDVQNMALQLFGDDFAAFVENDLYYDDDSKAMAALEQLQSDMLLVLKSGMASRRLLLDTVYPDETERQHMEMVMGDAAIMVGKLENAMLILPGYPDAPTDDDLSWMPDLVVLNNGGNYVQYRGRTYYWQIDPRFYGTDATVFANYGVEMSVSNKLVCRDSDGNVTTLLTAPGHGGIYIAGGKIYWQYDTKSDGRYGLEVHACALDGSGAAFVAPGTIMGYDTVNRRLVYQSDSDKIYLDDVADGSTWHVASDARVLQVAGGNIYYESKSTDSRTMKIYMMSTLTREPQLLVSRTGDPTASDHPSGGYSWFCADSRIYGEYLYIVNGVYAGTGYIFQGGCIGRVKLDGSGEYELLDGRSGNYTEDSFFIYTVDGVDYMNYVLYGKGTNWEYKITKINLDDGTAAMGGSTIAERRCAFPAGYVYSNTDGFVVNDPQTGGPKVMLSSDEVAALGFETYYQTGYDEDYTDIGFTALIGSNFYFSLVENIRDDSNDVGWRYSYRLDHRAAYVKNMETGEITKLFDF